MVEEIFQTVQKTLDRSYVNLFGSKLSISKRFARSPLALSMDTQLQKEQAIIENTLK